VSRARLLRDHLQRSCGVLLFAALVGCAPLPQRAVTLQSLPSEFSARLPILQAWAQFELTGKISVTRDGERVMAQMRWSQQDRQSRLRLDGPLGIGGGELSWETADDAVIAALERQLGVPLPAASLRYWLLGVPDPHLPNESLQLVDERVTSLQQAGWTLRYSRYAQVTGRQFELPARIDIEREQLALRLVIDEWRGPRR